LGTINYSDFSETTCLDYFRLAQQDIRMYEQTRCHISFYCYLDETWKPFNYFCSPLIILKAGNVKFYDPHFRSRSMCSFFATKLFPHIRHNTRPKIVFSGGGTWSLVQHLWSQSLNKSRGTDVFNLSNLPGETHF